MSISGWLARARAVCLGVAGGLGGVSGAAVSLLSGFSGSGFLAELNFWRFVFCRPKFYQSY